MLGIMRKYKESIVIKIVFVVIVLSFVGTIFLVWGRGDEGTGGSSYAVKVNGAKISFEQYQNNYNRLRSMFEQVNGKSLTPEMEKQMGLKKMAVDSLVDMALMRSEAKRMGIKVSKDDIQKAIAAVPSFQRNGVFDFQQYNQVLKVNRLSADKFEESQEQELLLQKARESIMGKAAVSDEEILQAFKKKNDRIDLYYVSFNPAELTGEVKASEEELNAFLQAHQEKFKSAEQVSISYCILDPSTVAAKVTVSDTDAQTFYQKNIDRYQGKGGILPYAEVAEKVKADALEFHAARQAYEMAADALNKNKSGNLAAIAATLGAKVGETGLFTVAAPAGQLTGESEVIKRAFTLKQGELGGPVETKKGIYILKLKERKPAVVPPLAQIRTQIEQGVKEGKAKGLAKQKAEQAIAELAKGGAPLKLQETGSFGYSAKGDIPKIGTSPETMDAAFALNATAPVAKAPFQIGERWYAMKLKNREELNKDAFARDKEQVKQELLPKKQQEAVEAWLKGLRDKAKIEINPTLLAE